MLLVRGLAPVSGLLTLALVATGCGSGPADEQAGSASGAKAVRVNLSNDGCQADPATVAAGPTTFTIKNEGGSSVSEAELVSGSRILGEKEGLTPGLTGSFSLDLKPGTYQLYCPNAKTERSDFVVTGTSSSASASGSAAAAVSAATAGYHSYLTGKAASLVALTGTFVTAVKAGQVDRAKALYAQARAPYEAIEPVAESFGDLDPAIDAREGDVPAAEWGGYHRIERQLWVAGNTAGMTPVADKLLADVTTLATRIAGSSFQAADLANGATELLTEVGKSKLTGEEERYSGTDLSDIAANLAGSRAAFDLLAPALAGSPAGSGLVTTIRSRFARADTLMAKHATGGGNYLPYKKLDAAAIRELTVAVDALAEPLSQLAEQVVTIR
jgi:iron uptake system component EfeO